jgi:hypothetical protein
MRKLTTLICLFTASILHAQDLTGIWQGHFRSSDEPRSSIEDDRYKFEVQIAQRNKTFQAVTYSYLSSVFYGKAMASGTVNAKTGKVLLQEGALIEVRMQPGSGACTMTCFLQYSRSGDDEFLEGSFGSMNIRDSSNCGRGTIFLRRVSNSDFYKEPFVAKREKEIADERRGLARNSKNDAAVHKKQPTTPGSATGVVASGNTASQRARTSSRSSASPIAPLTKLDIAKVPGSTQSGAPEASAPSTVSPLIIPEVLTNRTNELIRTITVNTNEVTLNIYDDGAIDNDSVTVFLDKRVVISHAMLTDQPIIVTLHLDETHNTHEVVMVADNEGTIPPNTSLMIVKAGDQEYEVRIASTVQRNAVVIFKYEPPMTKSILKNPPNP